MTKFMELFRRTVSPNQIKINKLWWDNRKDLYPYHARTETPPPVKPHKLNRKEFGDFMSAPCGEQDYRWGFKTVDARDRFVEQYDATAF